MRPESDRSPAGGSDSRQSIHRYPMAALIRFTLVGLYLALVLPLPLLAPPALRLTMLAAVPFGLLLVVAATSEMVEITSLEIRVGHPGWCAWLLRRGWTLAWTRVEGLTPLPTSQGGRVYYVRSNGEGSTGSSPQRQVRQAYLLPQRVDRFEDFLTRFSSYSGVDTSSVVRLTPPWTYRLLALLTGVLLGGELLFLALNQTAAAPIS